MQDSVLAVGLLVYAAAVVDAWRILPGDNAFKWRLTVLIPGACLIPTLAASLALPAVRRAVLRHLWLTYRTGFGQSVISVLVGLGLLVALAGLIVWQVHHLAAGGRAPAGGAFSGFAAGLGLLVAQVVLVRRLESDPEVRKRISAPEQDRDDS